MKRLLMLIVGLAGWQIGISQNTLDLVGLTSGTPAASAYSLRLLSTAYTGSAIQVRRSSDNATQDIGFNAGQVLDTTALKTFVGANSGYITIWYDQSGNARNMTQPTTGSQPIIINAGAIYYRNGKPTIYHDQIDDGLVFGSDYLTALPLSVNIIAGSNSNSSAFRRAVQGTSNWLIGPYSNYHSWFAGDWNHQIVAPWSLGNVEMFTVIEPVTDVNTSYRNGVAVASNNFKGVPSRMQTGAKGAYAEPLDGFVSEVLVFAADISGARNLLEQNQGSYFGILAPNPLDKNGKLNTVTSSYVNRNGAIGASAGIYRTGSAFTSLTIGTVTTNAASAIDATTAISGGTISSDGGANITAGVCYSTVTNPTIADPKTISTGASGSFTANISGLQGNTTYYARAYATNTQGTVYGNEISFTTLPPVAPTISSTTAASAINSTSATSGGTISSDGGATVTARGLAISSIHTPTIADTITSIGTGTGTFSGRITGLTLGVTYYVRAYATNSAGTSYGNQISFITIIGVGDAFQGGIIIYLFESGDPGYVAGENHGLIASTVNQSTIARWYNGTFITTAATATALGTGLSNSNLIVSVQGNTGTYAAKLCRDYNGGGYTDWYLPSKDELYKMYLSKSYLSSVLSNYWSSTEISSSTAYRISTITGSIPSTSKGVSIAVRAVRRF